MQVVLSYFKKNGYVSPLWEWNAEYGVQGSECILHKIDIIKESVENAKRDTEQLTRLLYQNFECKLLRDIQEYIIKNRSPIIRMNVSIQYVFWIADVFRHMKNCGWELVLFQNIEDPGEEEVKAAIKSIKAELLGQTASRDFSIFSSEQYAGICFVFVYKKKDSLVV